MTYLNPSHARAPTRAHAVRRIREADLNWALAEGWRDFREKRGDILVLALLYPVLGFAAAAVTIDDRLLPLFFPLVAGVSILGPAAASGFYEIARRREGGLDCSWFHFLDPIRGPNRGDLAILTLGLALLFVGWLGAASMITAATIGFGPEVGIHGATDFINRVLHTSDGWTLIVLGNLAGAVFAAATLVLGLVSFPMVVDGAADPWTAVATSVRAVRTNPGATLSWGMRVAGLLVLGSIPAFMGLAIVLPVLGYATWHLYTRMVSR